MSITTTIKSIQDIMRQDAGVDGDAQRISQLGWLIFLKLFDCAEDLYEWEETYLSPIPERLRWRNWAMDDEGITGDKLLEFINNDLFPTLKELALQPDLNPRGAIVGEVFADNYNFMKSGTLLRQVINKLDEIDFHNQEERHLFNDIYEKILLDLQSAGNAGEYYTPRAVTQFMADMINPQLGEIVMDPACGTGGFLVCALEHMRSQAKDAGDMEQIERNIRGIEKKPLPHVLCMTNFLLHGISVPKIVRDNSLTMQPYRSYTFKDRVDVVLTNPPFGGMEEPGVETGFPKAFQTRETADLFLVLVVHLLKEGGRAAIVLPDGSLFGEGVKVRIKEKLLSECNLHTLIRLPKGVFEPYTDIRTNLLFFTKGEPTEEVWYFEHPLPHGYKQYSKTRPILRSEFTLEEKWWANRKEAEHAWKVSIDEIRDRNFNLDIPNPFIKETPFNDPAELLIKYKQHIEDVQKTRNKLIETLKLSLSGLEELNVD